MMPHIYLINLVAIIPRVNSISNKCKFDVLRIDSKDILCQDYGYNKVYCNLLIELCTSLGLTSWNS